LTTLMRYRLPILMNDIDNKCSYVM